MTGLDIFYGFMLFIGIPAIVLGLFLLYWAATGNYDE